MPKLRRLAGRDVLTILQGFGFQQVSQRGSHVKLVRDVTEAHQVLTIPFHAELADCGKTRCTHTPPLKYDRPSDGPNNLRMLKKAVQQGRRERRGEAYASVR